MLCSEQKSMYSTEKVVLDWLMLEKRNVKGSWAIIFFNTPFVFSFPIWNLLMIYYFLSQCHYCTHERPCSTTGELVPSGENVHLSLTMTNSLCVPGEILGCTNASVTWGIQDCLNTRFPCKSEANWVRIKWISGPTEHCGGYNNQTWKFCWWIFCFVPH